MNEQQNINFVLEVEKYPCLYNSSLSSYYRRSETDKAWEEIGKVMNMTGIACKERWRNLRVVFIRHMKHLQNGSGCNKKKPYYLLDFMQFLTPFVKQTMPLRGANLPSTSSTEEADTVDDIIETQELHTAYENEPACENSEENNDRCFTNPKRKKFAVQEADRNIMSYSQSRPAVLHEYHNLNDPVTSFLDSLAPELKEMNLQQFKIFKRKVLTLVDDIMDTSATTTYHHEIPKAPHDCEIPSYVQKVSASSLDISVGSPYNNSNPSTPSLLIESTNIKTESEL